MRNIPFTNTWARSQVLDLPVLTESGCTASVLRLDELHPVISGNKWFKLKYHVLEALNHRCEALVTFGGPWSNHIIATACMASELGLASIGIIRGEEPARLSETLRAARTYGMQLEFTSREEYQERKTEAIGNMSSLQYPGAYVIPEGGAGPCGLKGAEEILQFNETASYSHILCCIGTGTMFAGLVNGSAARQETIGIPVLKGMDDLLPQLSRYIRDPCKLSLCRLFYDYHFGGYAKKTPALLQSMNEVYALTRIPTDFVYTGKLFFAFFDLLKKDYFKPGSNILIIHSGGLQGNASLREGELVFNNK